MEGQGGLSPLTKSRGWSWLRESSLPQTLWGELSFESLTFGPSFVWKWTKSYELQGALPLAPIKGSAHEPSVPLWQSLDPPLFIIRKITYDYSVTMVTYVPAYRQSISTVIVMYPCTYQLRICIAKYILIYTLWTTKKCHFILSDNSHVSRWIFKLVVSMKRGMNALQRS